VPRQAGLLYYRRSLLSNDPIRSFPNAVLIMVVGYGRLYACSVLFTLFTNRPVAELAVKAIHPNDEAMGSFDTLVERAEYLR